MKKAIGLVLVVACLVPAILAGGCKRGKRHTSRGKATFSNQSVPPRPAFAAINPRRGISTGGTAVTITGSGFVGGITRVTVNGNALVGQSVNDPSTITGTMPALVAGQNPSATIEIDNGQGGRVTRTQAFGYIIRLQDPAPAAADVFGSAFDDTAATRALVPARNYVGVPIATGDFNNDGRPDLAIGVPAKDLAGPVANAGQVLIFLADASGQFAAALAPIIEAVPVAGATFGFAIAAGEVSGDANVDLVIGAPGAVLGAANAFAGRAVVRTGNGAGAFPGTTALANIGQIDDLFGFSVAVGNFDGAVDAALEIVVGAPERNAGAGGEGAFVDYNSPGFATLGPVSAAGLNANRGVAVATIDLNADGLADLVMGDAGPNTGSGAVEFRRSDGTQADLTTFFPAALQTIILPTTADVGGFFGAGVVTGNFDGGSTDALAGQPLGDPGGLADAGRAEALFGNGAGGVAAQAQLFDPTALAGRTFGIPVAAGDLNGDGFSDVISSSTAATVSGLAGAGAVHLFLSNGVPRTFNFNETLTEALATAAETNAIFGVTVRSADFNGDGLADLVVANSGTAGGFANAGEVFVFYQPR